MSPPMRIMQVLEATAGGTRRHLREVVAALPRSRFHLHLVVAIRRDPCFADDVASYRRLGHEVSVLPMTRGAHALLDPLSLAGLRRLLRRWPCEVLHLHSAKAGLLGRLACRPGAQRVIYTPHAFPFLQRVSPPLRRIYELVERALARRTDTLCAVSAAEGRLAIAMGLYRPDQVVVLANALDITKLEHEVGAVPPVPPAGRSFALLGELRAQKDPFTFLEAARLVRQRGLDVRFAMPAEGRLLAAAQRYLGRHQLAQVVELVPASNDLSALYRRTDIGVLPSRWEGLPYTMLEAMALRRPVIAASLPVLSDLLEPLEPRLLFPPGDANALAARMALWAELPAAELTAFGERARHLVDTHHDMASWREGLHRLYCSGTPARSTTASD